MAKYDVEYVSEFERFMNDYLKQHPEVVVDQYRGRDIYWDKSVDFEAMKQAAEDSVPIDGGYYYFGKP